MTELLVLLLVMVSIGINIERKNNMWDRGGYDRAKLVLVSIGISVSRFATTCSPRIEPLGLLICWSYETF